MRRLPLMLLLVLLLLLLPLLLVVLGDVRPESPCERPFSAARGAAVVIT
jgi:hypothetical protein